MSEEPRSEDLSAEGEGETVGEAKWAAMKELEPRFPGITADSVSFDVVEEPRAAGPPGCGRRWTRMPGATRPR